MSHATNHATSRTRHGMTNAAAYDDDAGDGIGGAAERPGGGARSEASAHHNGDNPARKTRIWYTPEA